VCGGLKRSNANENYFQHCALFRTNCTLRSPFEFYTLYTENGYLTVVLLLIVFVGKKLEVDTVDHLEKDTVLVAFNSTVPFTLLVLSTLQGL